MRAQKARITFEHYLRAYKGMELIPPQIVFDMLPQLKKLEKDNKKSIKKYFQDGKDHLSYETQGELVAHPVYNWLMSIKGIDNMLAGKFIAYIDIDKTPKISSLWRYAGFDPNSERRKGMTEEEAKKCGNAKLKSFCYQLGDSFIKQRTPKYRDIYDKEKEKQIPICKEIDKKGWIGHAHNRARGKMVKIFLKDLFLEWKGKDHHQGVENTNINLSIPSISNKGGN